MNAYSDVKAFVFDMDGTLMDTDVDYAALGRVAEDEMVSLGVPEDIIAEDRANLSTDKCMKWVSENLPGSYDGIWDRIGDRATRVEMEHVESAKAFPGALELLGKLRSEGYGIGLLTRGGREYMEAVLRITGSADLFDIAVARDDYPHEEAKPDPRCMQHVADALGVSCKDILFMGDSRVDYDTAVNAGTKFIALCTGSVGRDAWVEYCGPSVTIVPTIADVNELIG